MMKVHDGLNFQKPHETIRDTYSVINAIQDLPPARQVAAVATAFDQICLRLGLDPNETRLRQRRVLKVADDLNLTEGRSLEFYIDNELKEKQLWSLTVITLSNVRREKNASTLKV